MKKILMNVYRMNHPDGQARKYWCYDQTGGEFVSRWGAANARLQEKVKPAIAAPWKTVSRKQCEGYHYQGRFWVTDEILWSEPTSSNATVSESSVSSQVKSKFDDVLLHWSAKRLPNGWQTLVIDALKDVVTNEEITVRQYDEAVEIGVYSKVITLNSKWSVGSIKQGYGDWMLGLILLRLSKLIPISLVDDQSNIVDRRLLKSLFITNGYQFIGEFEDFATGLGLIPKVDVTIYEAMARQF